jgi:ubiquitin-protein ligase
MSYFPGYQKRILRELNELEVEYKNVLSHFNYQKRGYEIKVRVGKSEIMFITPVQYPFKPPSILFNNKHYRNILQFRTEYFRTILEDNNIKCLCCESKLCTQNWYPSIRMISLVEEVKKNQNLILGIIYTRLVRQICESKGIVCCEIPELIIKQLIEGKLPKVSNYYTEG